MSRVLSLPSPSLLRYSRVRLGHFITKSAIYFRSRTIPSEIEAVVGTRIEAQVVSACRPILLSTKLKDIELFVESLVAVKMDRLVMCQGWLSARRFW
ncbi:hypothetical protein KCU74_g136, partial [Aureobasidium melanogenum]